jgi:hypothetical protein
MLNDFTVILRLPLNQTGLYVGPLIPMGIVLFESEVVKKTFHVVSLRSSESCVHLQTRLKSSLVILFKLPAMLISIST